MSRETRVTFRELSVEHLLAVAEAATTLASYIRHGDKTQSDIRRGFHMMYGVLRQADVDSEISHAIGEQ